VGRWFSRRGCLAKDNNDNNDANALHSHPSSSREVKEVIRRNRRYEGVSERIEGDEGEEGVGGGRRVWAKMENLPTELFLARILRPAACQNEEGNIISIPPPVTTPFRLRLLATRLPPRPIVLFLVNREFEL